MGRDCGSRTQRGWAASRGGGAGQAISQLTEIPWGYMWLGEGRRMGWLCQGG